MEPKTFLPLLALCAAGTFAAPSAHGAVISTTVIRDGPITGVQGGVGDAEQDSGITTSLITAGQTSLASFTPSRGADLFLAAGVNDGVATSANYDTLAFYNNLNSLPVTLTFKLSQAYNITSIVSLAGWGDSFFGSQIVQVLVETDNSNVYNSLATVVATPYTGGPPPGFPTVVSQDFSTRITFSDDTNPFVATNVTGVRFVYTDPYPTFNEYSGTVLRELSVFGTAVPEPSALLLGSLGLVPLLRRRRNKGN